MGVEPIFIALETTSLPEATERFGRGYTIRTCDILLPKQALYQAELTPDFGGE